MRVETLRLRFAETDNVATFNLGVDAVDVNVTAGAIPEPSMFVPAGSLNPDPGPDAETSSACLGEMMCSNHIDGIRSIS